MESHQDRDAQTAFQRAWMRSIENKASEIRAAGGSKITGGKPGEEIVQEWDSNNVHCRQLPDDPHMLRISIGGGATPLPANYCVFRGDRVKCIALLEQAIKAMQEQP